MIVEFAGLCSFFVLVILVQNTVSRRTKLRLLDLNQQYSAAKAALHEAMPSRENAHGSLVVSGAIEQSSGPVDGMLWTAAVEGESLLVLVVDPDGDGVDAAAVGLHVARSFEARRAERTGATPTLDEELRAIGAAAAAIPLARPVGALLLRVDVRSGAYEALCGSMAQLRTTNGQNVDAPELRPADGGPCEGILGPVLSATGTLAPGGLLLGVCTDRRRSTSRASPTASPGTSCGALKPGRRMTRRSGREARRQPSRIATSGSSWWGAGDDCD